MVLPYWKNAIMADRRFYIHRECLMAMALEQSDGYIRVGSEPTMCKACRRHWTEAKGVVNHLLEHNYGREYGRA